MSKIPNPASGNRILVCLDGSPDSAAAAGLALAIAQASGRDVVAAHVYDSRIHESRFRQMEPGLPEKYQDDEGMKELRSSHGSLMSDGFEALSHGYLREFLAEAEKSGVIVETVVEEGRNYVKLLEIADRTGPDITAFGAAGLGYMDDGMLGSAAVRMLRKLDCDVLVGRASAPATGPVLTGIDGSSEALSAMEKAISWTEALGAELHLAAAYDPVLHQQVFRAMAEAMPPAAQEAVGLDKQQGLHESLIDEGLGTLYRSFLDDASRSVSGKGLEPALHLLSEKAYIALGGKAAEINARIICLGRFGHNREAGSDIGATAEAVVRRAQTNVFIAGKNSIPPGPHAEDPAEMPWDPEALKRLQNVPRFVRKAAKRGIESAARSDGAFKVTTEHFEQVAETFRQRRRTKKR